eukprot:UN10898
MYQSIIYINNEISYFQKIILFIDLVGLSGCWGPTPLVLICILYDIGGGGIDMVAACNPDVLEKLEDEN